MAERIERVTGSACVLRGDDIDTDRIIPARYLRCVVFDGLGEHAFEDDREQAKGDHPFDAERFDGARILVVGRNFGCGSSREHAPWALADCGIRCIVAPDFADIFYSNCFQNGMLPIILPDDVVNKLLDTAKKVPGYKITVDLENQTVSDGESFSAKFDVDPFRKHCLLNGLDDIGLTLQNEAKITEFERKRAAAK